MMSAVLLVNKSILDEKGRQDLQEESLSDTLLHF